MSFSLRLAAASVALGLQAVSAQSDSSSPSDLTSATLSTVPPALDSTLSSSSWSTAPSPPTTTALTSVVPVFYIDSGNEYGIPYTMLHRDCGSVIGFDATATTIVLTRTFTDQRTPTPGAHTRTDNVTTNIPTLRRHTESGPPPPPGVTMSSGSGPHWNRTARPSTITQGPSTFLFTGSNYGPGRTVVNRCDLNGTTSASCNLTHVGSGWYTKLDPAWNGTFSTYNYSWTSGDRFGFAPVTLTEGVEMLPRATASSTSTSRSGAATGRGWRGGRAKEAGGLVFSAVLAAGICLGVFAVL